MRTGKGGKSKKKETNTGKKYHGGKEEDPRKSSRIIGPIIDGSMT